MKITFLASGSVRSNFTYRILKLAEVLHSRGHEVSIIAPIADKYNNFIPEKIDSISGVHILQPFQFMSRRFEINLLPYIFGAIYMLFQSKPDIVYIYKPTPISVIGLLKKLIGRTPIVLDMDDLGSEVMRIEGHPVYIRKLVEWSEKLAARYADRIVVASTFLENTYRKQFPAKPIYKLPNGVDSEWFGEILEPREEKSVVFLGALNRKNILVPLFEVFPNVIEKIPETKLLVMGGGSFLEYFKQKAKELCIEKNIEFAGWVPLAEAQKRLKSGDIGYNYMPDEDTIKAASNMKVSQYMACGVVPLVSAVGDLETAVDEGRAGYIAEAGDHKSLEDTLLAALQDDQRKEKSLRAQEYAREHFDWKTLAAGFDEWLIQSKNQKEKTDRTKIYVVATSVPADVGGGEIRNYNLIRQLVKDTRNDVHLFCISAHDIAADRKKFMSHVSATCTIVPERSRTVWTTLRAVFIKRVPPFMDDFESTGLGNVFREACERSLPDVVHIEQIHAFYCIRKHVSWLKSRGVKIVFDCHNIEYMMFKESLAILPLYMRITGYYLAPNMKRIELEAVKASGAVLACSDENKVFFESINQNTYLIPNGINSDEYASVTKSTTPTIIFMGGTKYPPNADAVRFYIREIHPVIRKTISGLEVLLIGTTKEWLEGEGLAGDGLVPLGFVDDVRPHLHHAVVGICPVRYGSGTRIKIMTYMAAGLPVVSTTKGAEGVGYTHNENIIIADDGQTFANAVIDLLHDSKRAPQIAQKGKDFVKERYDWNVIGKRLLSLNIYEKK